jgi:transcriptional regulator with XRE-family HTH domain
MVYSAKREYAMRSKLPEIVRQREIELGRRISIKELADETGLNRNTISSWLSPVPFGRVDSHAAITLRRWANCSWDDLLQEVEMNIGVES